MSGLSVLIQGRVTISNDGATIMKLLDIVHPAAKVLADISMSQDAEVSRQKAVLANSPWSVRLSPTERNKG